jgi:nucleoside-diphosphate-sugar epimerase
VSRHLASLRVLVAGCGYLGSALASELAADGHAVFGLRRNPAGLPPGVTAVAADLDDLATLRSLPRGLDVVVYAAAADGFSDAAYRASYVDGPRHLIAALAAAGERPRRLLFTSSTAVYGQSDGVWVDETSATDPPGFSGARLLEGEAVVAGGPFPSVVVRLGGIYGPGRTRLVESVRSGAARLRRGPPRYTNRIHRDDGAGALRHLIGLASPEACYLAVDSEPADERDVLRFLARALGVPEPPEADPAEGPGARPGERPRGSKRCSNRRLLASGYALRFPTFREGYAALVGREDCA